MSREHKEAVVRRYVECLEKKDISTIQSIYARDATLEDPVGSEPLVGIDAILEFYETNAFPPVLTAGLTGPVRCPQNAAAFPFRLTFKDAEDEDAIQTIDIIDVFEFDGEGRVISMKAYWD